MLRGCLHVTFCGHRRCGTRDSTPWSTVAWRRLSIYESIDESMCASPERAMKRTLDLFCFAVPLVQAREKLGGKSLGKDLDLAKRWISYECHTVRGDEPRPNNCPVVTSCAVCVSWVFDGIRSGVVVLFTLSPAVSGCCCGFEVSYIRSCGVNKLSESLFAVRGEGNQWARLAVA